MATNDARKDKSPTRPRYQTLRPYSLTVNEVKSMDVAFTAGETEGFVNVKLERMLAIQLLEIIQGQLDSGREGLITFSLRGKIK